MVPRSWASGSHAGRPGDAIALAGAPEVGGVYGWADSVGVYLRWAHWDCTQLGFGQLHLAQLHLDNR